MTQQKMASWRQMDWAIPKLGVLGGMGPAATVDFLRKLVAETPASTDQEHVPTVVYSAPYTPDRTASILGQGPSPLPVMLNGMRLLEQLGASCVAIPCNTAHYWYSELMESSAIPILHIADAACDHAAQKVSVGGCIGILATAGTLVSGVYQRRIESRGYQCLNPEQRDLDELIMPAIYQVKAGNIAAATPLLEQAKRRLVERGAGQVIMACTEIPLALEIGETEEFLIDATQALARNCVNWWLGLRKNSLPLGKEEVLTQ
ncbi:MAG: aspartate/glutamate racemase family protein [Pseudolabrys sp.]